MNMEYTSTIDLKEFAADIATYKSSKEIADFVAMIDTQAADQDVTEEIILRLLEQSLDCTHGFKKSVRKLLDNISKQD